MCCTTAKPRPAAAIPATITSIVNWLTSLDDKTKDTIIKIAAVAAVVAAVGPVLLVGGKLITGIGKVIKNVGSVMKVISGATKVTGLLGKAMTALTGPVDIVIAVIAVLAAAFYSLYKNNEEFRNKVNAIWANICAAFEKVKAVFVSAFQTMQSYATKEGTSITRQTGEVEWTAIKCTSDGRYQAGADEGENGFTAEKAAAFLNTVYTPVFIAVGS